MSVLNVAHFLYGETDLKIPGFTVFATKKTWVIAMQGMKHFYIEKFDRHVRLTPMNAGGPISCDRCISIPLE
jgi:hypothetical protein